MKENKKCIKCEAKIIKKYPEAVLKSCGQRKTKTWKSHMKGCYLRLTDNDIKYSRDDLFIVVDFDKNNKLVGIEFVDGL
jgi:hypothetical protein